MVTLPAKPTAIPAKLTPKPAEAVKLNVPFESMKPPRWNVVTLTMFRSRLPLRRKSPPTSLIVAEPEAESPSRLAEALLMSTS